MTGFEIFLIAVGLSMDAFAVSISNGLSMKKIAVRKAITIGVAFGGFQALMPLLGYSLGLAFSSIITRYDHYVALVFLSFIGGKMLYDGILSHKSYKEVKKEEDDLSFLSLIIQAIATSVDALIVGISFTAMGLDFSGIIFGVAVIGIITFAFSFCGVYMGKKFGELLGVKAEIIGGIILIGIGVKIFTEHVFFGG